MNVRPHVARRLRGSAIDRRTTRHPGCGSSQRVRKPIEEAFGWMRTVGGMRRPMRRPMRRGTDRLGWSFTFVAAAYNLVGSPKLLVPPDPGPSQDEPQTVARSTMILEPAILRPRGQQPSMRLPSSEAC